LKSIWVLVIPPRRRSSMPTSLRNRNLSLPTFLEKTRISLRGSLPTCQVFRESWRSTDWILTLVQSRSSSIYDDSH
jgi:hypothetical protein